MSKDRTGLALGEKVLELDGVEYTIKMKVGDIRNYLATIRNLRQKKEKSPELLQDIEDELITFQIDFASRLLSQGNPELPKEDCLLIAEMNMNAITRKLPVVLNLVSEKDMESINTAEDSKN